MKSCKGKLLLHSHRLSSDIVNQNTAMVCFLLPLISKLVDLHAMSQPRLAPRYWGAWDYSEKVHQTQNANKTVHTALLARLFQHHFSVPPEICSTILDYAEFWPSRTCTIHREYENMVGYRKMITTYPLNEHVPIQNQDEGKTITIPARGSNPYRRLKVKVWAKAYSTPGGCHPSLSPHDYRDPLTVNVIWPGYADDSIDIPRQKYRERIFTAENLSHVYWLPVNSIGRHEEQESSRWLIALFDEPLTEEIQEREVIWDWTDEGPGGDLVRSMEVGDALQLRTRRDNYPPALTVPKIEVEIFYATDI